jgi:uncharacterized membrane protein
MAKKAKSGAWVVRVARGHRRLWIAIALTAATFALLRVLFPDQAIAWLLVGWNIGAIFYIAATASMMARSPTSEIRQHSAEHDEGALALLAITVAAAVALTVNIASGIIQK